MPHRTASANSVIWGEWHVAGADDNSTGTKNIRSWDFNSVCSLQTSVMVHKEHFLESTGLSSLQDVALVAQIECPATYLRSITKVALDESSCEPQTICVQLAPGTYVSQLTASLQLVLNDDCPSRADPTVATRKGARLAASQPLKIQLDSGAARFPTDAFPFSGVLPADVPWLLNVAYEDLDDAFLGAARLLINTSHPAGIIALDDNHPAAAVVRSVLSVDVSRSLLQQVAARDRSEIQQNAQEFDPNSIGYVAASMSRSQLKASLPAVMQMISNDPSEFESRIQASLSYLKELENL